MLFCHQWLSLKNFLPCPADEDEACIPEDGAGTVLVRDDLDSLLQVIKSACVMGSHQRRLCQT